MSKPFPLEMRLEDLIPVTEAQKQFVATAKALVIEFGARLGKVIHPAKFDCTSSIAPSEVGDASCVGSGFVSQRLGFLIAAYLDKFLFYNGDANAVSFSVAYKCPKAGKEDDKHYHVGRDSVVVRDVNLWKQFPIGDVLEGLEELYQRLAEEQRQYEEAHAVLENKLLALHSLSPE